jgi:hypothetical protein
MRSLKGRTSFSSRLSWPLGREQTTCQVSPSQEKCIGQAACEPRGFGIALQSLRKSCACAKGARTVNKRLRGFITMLITCSVICYMAFCCNSRLFIVPCFMHPVQVGSRCCRPMNYSCPNGGNEKSSIVSYRMQCSFRVVLHGDSTRQ